MRINSNIGNYARITKNSDTITKKIKKNELTDSSGVSPKLTTLSSVKEADDLMNQTMNMIRNSSIPVESLFSNIDGSRIENLLA